MLYFNKIDVSEEVDVNKTSVSKECEICHYWYFLNKGFKFQQNACKRCHDLLIMSMNISDIAILSIKSADYFCIISGISKNEATSFGQEKGNIVKHKNVWILKLKK